MSDRRGNWRDSTRAANDDFLEWTEYEAAVARAKDPIGMPHVGDPDPRYDLAKMLDTDYKSHLSILQLENYLDHTKKEHGCLDDAGGGTPDTAHGSSAGGP